MPPRNKNKVLNKDKAEMAPATILNDNSDPNSPVAQQFELELCWCIQQLQNALKLGKLNPAQVKDHTKSVNALMSSTTPIVRKRQVMRLSFGDYRAKMAEDDKKFKTANSKTKIKPIQLNNAKSVFVKKSSSNQQQQTDFKFNFTQTECAAEETNNANHNTEKEYHFQPSDNSFKFNFNYDNE